MCAVACAATTRAHAPHTRRFLINHAAIRNARNFHKNNALAFSNRLKFARSGAVRSPHKPPVTHRESLLVHSHSLSRPSLFDANEPTLKTLTCSQ
jgi:hypothetical protein